MFVFRHFVNVQQHASAMVDKECCFCVTPTIKVVVNQENAYLHIQSAGNNMDFIPLTSKNGTHCFF